MGGIHNSRQFKLFTLILLFLISGGIVKAQAVPESIEIIYGMQTINPIEIDESTGLLSEITSSDEVTYSMQVSLIDETDVSQVKVYLGSSLGATDLCSETISFSNFTETSPTKYCNGDVLKFTSGIKLYQEDIYYEVFIYDLNGNCSYHGTGQSNN